MLLHCEPRTQLFPCNHLRVMAQHTRSMDGTTCDSSSPSSRTPQSGGPRALQVGRLRYPDTSMYCLNVLVLPSLLMLKEMLAGAFPRCLPKIRGPTRVLTLRYMRILYCLVCGRGAPAPPSHCGPMPYGRVQTFGLRLWGGCVGTHPQRGPFSGIVLPPWPFPFI